MKIFLACLRHSPAPVLVGAFTIFLTACGGGGGNGSAPFTTADSDNPLSDAIPPQVTSADCVAELDDLLERGPDGTRRVVGGVLENVSDGCDYLVSDSAALGGQLIIAPGVTFAVTAGVSISFRDAQVDIQGQSAAPIRFQPSASGQTWRGLNFRDSDVAMQHLLVTGAGDASGAEDAAVQVTGSSFAMSDTTIADSRSNGLRMSGSEAQVSLFRNNVFQGNALYGVVIGNLGFAGVLDSSSNFAGGSMPNGNPGVLVVEAGSSASGVSVPDTGQPYVLTSSNSRLPILRWRGILIEAGVEFQVPADTGIDFDQVTVNGTAAAPVTFDVLAGSGVQWGGITVSSPQPSVLRHMQIRNAGAGPGSSGGALSLTGQSASLTVEETEFVNSSVWGIFCRQGGRFDDVSAAGIIFSGSGAGDIHPDCDFDIDDGQNGGATLVDASVCAEQIIATNAIRETFVFSNTDASCDYYIVGALDFQSTVLLEPGVSLLFARDASIRFGNTVTARGTQAAPIELQAEADEEGYWGGVTLNGRGNVLEHVSIANGGNDTEAGLRIGRASGFPQVNADAVLNNVSISGSLGNGLSIESDVQIVEFSDNAFFGNAGVGLSVYAPLLSALDDTSMYDSALAANGREGIRLTARSAAATSVQLSEDDVVLSDLGVPWRIPSLSITRSVTLVVEPGVDIIVETNGEIRVSDSATVDLRGSVTEPITVSGLAAAPRDWQGFDIGSGTLVASNAVIIGGGLMPEPSTSTLPTGAVELTGSAASLSLSSTTIRDSHGWGITCARTSVQNLSLSEVVYDNNATGTINPACGS